MKRILIIDNDLAILEVLTFILKDLGYGVEEAGSGREAVEKISREAFDAILLDIHLDDTDGMTIYQKLKERSPSLAQKIIFVTGDMANPKTRSLIEHSGNRSLIKPFTFLQVEQILRDFFPEGG